jgi:hypothetical protein
MRKKGEAEKGKEAKSRERRMEEWNDRPRKEKKEGQRNGNEGDAEKGEIKDRLRKE